MTDWSGRTLAPVPQQPETVKARRGSRRYAPDAASYTHDIANQLLSDFQARDASLRETEAVLFRRHELRVPKAYEDSTIRVKAPIALDMVNSIVAAMTINPPAVQFEPIAGGSEAQNNAELREKFFSASWVRQEQEAGRQLFRAWMWNLAAYGEAVVKTVERKHSAWGSYRQQAKDIDKAAHTYPPGGAQKAKDEAKKAAPYPIKSTDVPRTSSTTGWGRADTRTPRRSKASPTWTASPGSTPACRPTAAWCPRRTWACPARSGPR